MCWQVAFQGFFACNKGQTARKLPCHEVTGLAQFLFVRFRDEIFDNKLPGRNTSNCDGTFNNGGNYLNGKFILCAGVIEFPLTSRTARWTATWTACLKVWFVARAPNWGLIVMCCRRFDNIASKCPPSTR
jgi:hypothetical protein